MRGKLKRTVGDRKSSEENSRVGKGQRMVLRRTVGTRVECEENLGG
jgi:hypothetical protein